MILDNGRIAEYDRCVFGRRQSLRRAHIFCSPSVLLRDNSSKFHALCKATGKEEFSMLKKKAGV